MKPVKRIRTRTTSAKSGINVTPLIDVLLVLLVIFMVIAPSTPTGLPAEVPQNSPEKQQPEDELVITLESNGNLLLNHEEVQSGTLFQRLTELFRTRADRTLFVRADESVLFNEVAEIIDTAVGAGADHVGLLPKTLQ